MDDLLAARRPYGDLLLWPEKVEPMLIAPDPSIAHTARAVRALAQVQAVRPAAQVREALDQAAAWLVGRDLGNVSEIIDRPMEAGTETLYTRHFTAAWVVKALVSVGLPASHPAVSEAVTWIWGGYSDTASLWSWNNGDLPIWMTYDALDALRLASLASTVRRADLGISERDRPGLTNGQENVMAASGQRNSCRVRILASPDRKARSPLPPIRPTG